MKSVILIVIAISTMFVQDATWFKEPRYQRLVHQPGRQEYGQYHGHGALTVHQQYHHDNLFREVEDREEKTLNFLIVPGTDYCGLGNSLGSLNSFVVFKKTDKCCEAHDDCEAILSGTTKYGLTNKGIFPAQSCHCDHTFKECLLTANTWLSYEIGEVYFNSWGKHCFDFTPPFKSCGGFSVIDDVHRCTDPIYHEELPPTYRWFAVPFYIKAAPRTAIEDTEIIHNHLEARATLIMKMVVLI